MKGRNGSNDLGLSALFKGIGGFLELISDLAENQGELKKDGELRDNTGKVRGLYGISVRTGIGGKPCVETFGNVRRTEAGPVVEETREPIFDIFDERERIHVLVELPGADPSKISLDLNGDILEVSAEGPGRKYSREILLPSPPDRDSLSHTFANGILEIYLEKRMNPNV